jgi:hypothetical protein
MKGKILLLGLLLLLLVPGASAVLLETFQDGGQTGWVYVSADNQISPPYSSMSIAARPNYPELIRMKLHVESGRYWGHVAYTYAWYDIPTTSNYFAFTSVGTYLANTENLVPLFNNFNYGFGGGQDYWQGVMFYDSEGTLLYSYNGGYNLQFRDTVPHRWEFIRNLDSIAMSVYKDGVFVSTIGTSNVAPSYMKFYIQNGGDSNYASVPTDWWVDDINLGDTSCGQIGTLPYGWYLRKDILNSAVTGVYDPLNNIVRTNTFYSTFGNNVAFCGYHNNTPVNLIDASGVTWETFNASTGAGIASYNLVHFFASAAPYGKYQLSMPELSGATGFPDIWYIATGATITWDRTLYSSTDSATITYTISDGNYDIETYDYKIKVLDYNGVLKTTFDLQGQSGNKYITFNPVTYSEGIYFAELDAVRKSDSKVITLFWAQTQIRDKIIIIGQVLNAPNVTPIFGATITLLQGLSTSTSTTDSNGRFNNSATWTTSTPLYVGTTASGYRSDNFSFTPLGHKTYNLTIPLLPNTLTPVGISGGGLVRLKPYYSPADGAYVFAFNASGNLSTVRTNAAGYYVFNNAVNNRTYTLTSGLVRYNNYTPFQQLFGGL